MATATRLGFKPQWVMGLRDKLEEIMNSAREGSVIIGKARRIMTDGLEIVELRIIKPGGNPTLYVKLKGDYIEFGYPIKTKNFDEVYYGILRLLTSL